MNPLVTFISRWLHVGSAITLLGGSLFVLLVLMPAAAKLPDEQRKELHERVMGRWRKVVGAAIGVLLLTGLFNYIVIAAPAQRGLETRGMYHGLMGMKILLSLGVFFLASALTGRAKAFDKLRANARMWMLLAVVLGATIVAIGSYLRVNAWPRPNPPTVPAVNASPDRGMQVA